MCVHLNQLMLDHVLKGQVIRTTTPEQVDPKSPHYPVLTDKGKRKRYHQKSLFTCSVSDPDPAKNVIE